MPKIIEEEREDDISPNRTPNKESDEESSEKKINRYRYVFHHKSISNAVPLNLDKNAS